MSAAGSARSTQDTGCWYDRIAAGLAASVEGESRRAAGARDAARPSTSRRSSATRGWAGDGFELVNDGRIVEPEQQELAARSRRRSSSLGARARAGRARSTDAARALAAAARRGAQRAARLQPARRGRRASAGSAAGCCTSCCATCRRCRRPSAPRRRAASSPSRRMASSAGRDRRLGGRGAGRHRGARLTRRCSPKARAPRCR